MAKKKSAVRRSARKPAAKKSAARKAPARKTAAKTASSRRRTAKPARRKTPAARRPSLQDVRNATVRRDIGGVRLEAAQAGDGRVKRMVYPAGYRWSAHTKPFVGTDYCMHAHVGFLTQGRIDVVYPDGCVESYQAPAIVAVAPGHDGHVVGSEAAVLIEFDFESDTISRFGMPDAHRHD
jgi:hypothetical protein